MSTDKGYIKLYRDIRDHWVWSDKSFSRGQAWIDLLMLVNHKDKKTPFDGKVIVVKRGSKILSIRKLSIRWGWSKDKVSRFLNMLESDSMILQKRDSRKTLVTVVNYGFYQGSQGADRTVTGHSSDTDRTVSGHSSDTDRNKQECKKNDKNGKNVKEPPISPIEDEAGEPWEEGYWD